MPSPGQRKIVSDEVAQKLEALILDGTFAPGDRLPPERELAEQLHVNRSSLREALKKLEQLRLVEIQQGSGIRVRSVDEASIDLVKRLLFSEGRPNLGWIRDLLELRELLFVGLMRLALDRGSESELREFVRVLGAAADPDISEERFVELLSAAQNVCVTMTHNQVVMLLWNSIRHFMAQAMFTLAQRRLGVARREMLPMLRRFTHAVEARDVDTALRAVRDLIRREESQLLQAFEDMLGKPSDH